jgi:hypothetical protein
MSTSTQLEVLHIVTISALVAFFTQAAPALAADARDEVHFTRAGGPRVEQRVTPVKGEPTRMVMRATRYFRG